LFLPGVFVRHPAAHGFTNFSKIHKISKQNFVSAFRIVKSRFIQLLMSLNTSSSINIFLDSNLFTRFTLKILKKDYLFNIKKFFYYLLILLVCLIIVYITSKAYCSNDLIQSVNPCVAEVTEAPLNCVSNEIKTDANLSIHVQDNKIICENCNTPICRCCGQKVIVREKDPIVVGICVVLELAFLVTLC
jgi:hypothetical protein